uniref:Uncharacterized protein n=1 Tax=Cacopsylla melanoneura TaxID=428564 RepID=A0A8D8Z1Z8_9HEMI
MLLYWQSVLWFGLVPALKSHSQTGLIHPFRKQFQPRDVIFVLMLLGVMMTKICQVKSKYRVFILYRISYLWYSSIGMLITVLMGLAISVCTGPHDPRLVHSDLQSPPLYHMWMSMSKDSKLSLGLPIQNETNEVKSIGSIFSTNLKHFSSINQHEDVRY